MMSVKLGHYDDVLQGQSFHSSDWKLVEDCLVCTLSKDGRMRGLQRGRAYANQRSAITEDLGLNVRSTIYNIGAKVDVQVCFDLVFVRKNISLLVIVKPHNYLLHTWVGDRTTESVFRALVLLIQRIRAGRGIGRVLSVKF
jgi:hypothetical protein